MKKVLIVLAVLAFAVSTAFASVTTVTKENSTLYPGVLADDSLNGASVFITDAAAFGKVALLEANFGSTWALVSTQLDFGQIIISSSPNPDNMSSVTIDIDRPDDVIGLTLLPKLDNLVLGVGLLVGKYDSSTEYKNKEDGMTENSSSSRSYYGIQLGAKIEGISLGLKVRMAGDEYKSKNYDTLAPNNLDSEDQDNASALGIDVAAKTKLGDWTVAAMVAIDNGENTEKTKSDSNNDGDFTDATDTNETEVEKDSVMGISVLGGVNLGKTEKIKVDLATGINYASNQSTITTVKDENSGITDYGSANKITESEITWVLNVGVEANLNETWTVNAGTRVDVLRLYNDAEQTQDDLDSTTNDYRDYRVSSIFDMDNGLDYGVGLTGVIGALTIDMELNPVILLVGPEFISSDFNDNLNAQIALIYNY